MAGIFERIVQGLNLAELVTSYRRSRPESISDHLDEVMAASGEATGFAMAQDCLRALLDLPDEQLPELLDALSSRFTIDHEALRQAADAYQAASGAETYKALLDCAAPPRRELLRRLNSSPGGTLNLVRLRERLLSVPGYRIVYPEVDIDFIEAFISWFNRGFLELRPITWETPANILEKIISYEAVHEITSWEDLRRRMDPRDRRCFGYFHPAMPDEPLIFVQIALTQDMPDAMPPLLDEHDDAADGVEADTACFYSISNCQIGLRGISFGNFLIKQVAAELKAEFPSIKTFCTLSPMPGFRKWTEQNIKDIDEEDSDFLMRAAAHYICAVKGDDGYPTDPVARFHLGNGAIAWRLCPGANPSPVGSAQSMGMMINYRYDDDQVIKNHERHAETGEIAASPAIHSLQEKFKLPVE